MRNFASNWSLFRGRIGRRRYWALTLLYVFALFAGMAAFVAAGILTNAGSSDAITLVMVPIGIIFLLSMTVLIASVGVRRLHDRGKSGFWLILYYSLPMWMTKSFGLEPVGVTFLVVGVGILAWGIVDLVVLRGEAGTNVFGPSPLAEPPAPNVLGAA